MTLQNDLTPMDIQITISQGLQNYKPETFLVCWLDENGNIAFHCIVN